jgi:ABC-type lipoprotein export system ATPase subunit
MALLVELNGVHRTFVDGAQQIEVLKDLSLNVEAGEFIAIMGISGAGKSSILNIIAGLDIGFSGSAKILGQDLQAISDDARSELRNHKMGFVFQSFHLLKHLSVLENVCVPAWLNRQKISLDLAKSKAMKALGFVGLEDRAASNIGVLSGGERQRVAIARAVAGDPSLILADEPTGNLDAQSATGIVEYFDQARREGERAVLVVTHDPRVSERADRVLRLENGGLICA